MTALSPTGYTADTSVENRETDMPLFALQLHGGMTVPNSDTLERLSYSCIKIPRKPGIDKDTENVTDDDFFWIFESETETRTLTSMTNLIRPEIIKRVGIFPNHLHNIEELNSLKLSVSVTTHLKDAPSASRCRRHPRRRVEPSTLLRNPSDLLSPSSAAAAASGTPNASAAADHLGSLSPQFLEAITAVNFGPSVASLLSLIKEYRRGIHARQKQLPSMMQQQMEQNEILKASSQASLPQQRIDLLQFQLQRPVHPATSPCRSNVYFPTPFQEFQLSSSHSSDRLSSTAFAAGIPSQLKECSQLGVPLLLDQFSKQSTIAPAAATPSSSSFVFPTSSLYGELQCHLQTGIAVPSSVKGLSVQHEISLSKDQILSHPISNEYSRISHKVGEKVGRPGNFLRSFPSMSLHYQSSQMVSSEPSSSRQLAGMKRIESTDFRIMEPALLRKVFGAP